MAFSENTQKSKETGGPRGEKDGEMLTLYTF